MNNNGLALIAPRLQPPLDPAFRPAVLANRAFQESARASNSAMPVRIGLEQNNGNVSHFETCVFAESDPRTKANFIYIERILRFLLWSRGGFRIYFDGPPALAAKLAAYYRETPTGRFDSEIVAERMFDHPVEVIHSADLPPERRGTASLG